MFPRKNLLYTMTLIFSLFLFSCGSDKKGAKKGDPKDPTNISAQSPEGSGDSSENSSKMINTQFDSIVDFDRENEKIEAMVLANYESLKQRIDYLEENTKNNLLGQMHLFLAYVETGKKDLAIKGFNSLKDLAEKHNFGAAYFHLAQLYSTGTIIKPDEAKVDEYLATSSKLGFLHADYSIAFKGVSQQKITHEEYMTSIRECADKGSFLCQRALVYEAKVQIDVPCNSNELLLTCQDIVVTEDILSYDEILKYLGKLALSENESAVTLAQKLLHNLSVKEKRDPESLPGDGSRVADILQKTSKYIVERSKVSSVRKHHTALLNIYMYELDGQPFNYDQVIKELNKSLEGDCPTCLLSFYEFYKITKHKLTEEQSKELQKVIQKAEKTVDQKNHNLKIGQSYALSLFYKDGVIVTKDIEKAISYLIKSSYTWTNNFSAVLLHTSSDNESAKKGLTLYFNHLKEKADELEQHNYEYLLGLSYVLGLGTEQNVDLGVSYLNKAAAKNNIAALQLLTQLFHGHPIQFGPSQTQIDQSLFNKDLIDLSVFNTYFIKSDI